MDTLNTLYKQAKSEYDADGHPLSKIREITRHCLDLLRGVPVRQLKPIGEKSYSYYFDGSNLSRPYRPDLFILDPDNLAACWDDLVRNIKPEHHLIDTDVNAINQILYTSVMSFSIVYDLKKPKSRKTPGTFFEVLLGSIMGRLIPGFRRTKHVSIPRESESVSTDIVFTRPDNSRGIVIPVKITTRERIVQPFAHQRVLDAVFGEGKFHSLLVCVSETQRDKETGVNEICVPGTIRMFQAYLAKLGGIYVTSQ